MNRREKLWNDKEITTTLTAPGTIRTAVGRKIWGKIPGKTCVKILIDKCGCLEHCLEHRLSEYFYTDILCDWILKGSQDKGISCYHIIGF